MFYPVPDSGAQERHDTLRKAVHRNRNLVSQLQHETRRAEDISRRSNFAAHQVIEVLEEARKANEQADR
jgi:hypothetical protein